MEAGRKALRCFVLSVQKSFFREIKNGINNLKSGIETFHFENLNDAIKIISDMDIIFIEDDIILSIDETKLSDFFTFLSTHKNYVILATNYKRKLPKIIDLHLIHFISKSLPQDEFLFHLGLIETYIKKSTYGLNRSREKHLADIIKIQQILLSNLSSESSIKNVLEVLGHASGAGKVSLFEDRHDDQQKRLMALRCAWANDNIDDPSAQSLLNLLPYEPNFVRWEELLSSGEAISGSVIEFPDSERSLLAAGHIKRILLLPILVKGDFWGFVMFAGYTKEEAWSLEEISWLKFLIAPLGFYLEKHIKGPKRDIKDDRLRRIFEGSNIGLVLWNRDGNIGSYNPAFLKMLGYTNDELKNLNFRIFSHPDDLIAELPLLQKLIDGKIPSYLIEKRFIKKGGDIIWVKFNVSAHSDEYGKPDSLIAIVENITKEKETEKALLKSEERYRKFSELSLEGIVIHQSGEIIDCNDRFLEISGYSRKEMIGANLAKFLIGKPSEDLLAKTISSDDVKPTEAIGITKLGEKVPIEFEDRIVEYDDEHLRVTVFRDIEQRKKHEQEIRKLNIAINQSPSSIVITDKKGIIEYVNKSFSDVTGYSFEEAVGKNPRILKTNYHSKEYYKHLWDTITRGKTWYGTFRNRSKSGAFYWERAVISPVFDDKNQIANYLAIKENITKEKKIQEALRISEERHRIISELTNDFVYSAILSGVSLNLDWTSGSVRKLAGYSMKEIEGMECGWYSVALRNDFDTIIQPALKILQKEKIITLEYRIKAKDGSIKWVIDNIKLIQVENENYNVIGAIRDITLRKEANLALDQSKKYLDSIIDNLPIGLHIFDDQGYSARINETQRKLLGLKSIDVGIEAFNVLNDPLSITSGSDEVYKDVYKNKTTVNREIEIDFDARENQWDTRKGKMILNEIIFPILKKDGSLHSVISLNTDITNRVQAEKALKASEKHQKALLKIIPDLIFVFTEEGIFKDIYTDDSNRLLIPNEQFLGKSFSDVFPTELSNQFYTYLKMAVDTQEMQSYNYELEVNGIVFYYETRLLISKENEVIAIIRDITDSVEAEKAIKESEEKFRELAERTQDALVLISVKNEILYVSPNLKSILGITPESYEGNPLSALNLIHRDDKYWVIHELNKYRKGKQAKLDLQFRVILKDQSQRWIWYRESCVYDENNQPIRYAAVITDISANKIAEEELKIAKEAAERANRSKSVFLANISHEIRTPMNAVLGFSELLYSRIHDPVLKGYLNSIKSSGSTLLNLLNDILDLSKIEANKMSLNPSPANLHNIFDEIKHIFSLKALEKGLDYSFNIDKNIPSFIFLDELRFKQVLLNLVDNAVKFTEKGIIRVIAKIVREHTDKNTLDLSIVVEDTGIGIPPNLQESIFESFRQQDDQDKRKFHGTGLGLAITKRLVQLLNGEIKVQSQLNRGSKFEIILRDIEISKRIFPEEKARENKEIRFEPSVFNNKVVLIIDQEKLNRDLIKEVFHESKSTVIEGTHIEEIVPELKRKVDLIIMEINNHDTIRNDLANIKKYRNLHHAPKIGISSLMEIEPSVEKAFKSILTKPINLPKLVETVEEYILSEEHPISKESIDKDILAKVINLLEGKHYSKWESTLLTSSFSEIETFAQDIKRIGLEYNLKSLLSFSDVLVMHAKNFDIDNMNSVLHSYPSILNELKKHI